MPNVQTFEIEDLVDYEQREDGTHVYTCKNKLWSVESMNRTQAIGDAMHYWLQYWLDGEYNLPSSPHKP